jgi:cation:H+ antiporter
MELSLAVVGLIVGLAMLLFSSERTVEQLIKLASSMGASVFTVGFLIASIGTDMPEIVNSFISSALGHGDISVGDSFGSVLAQISIVLGLIPFFCTFCRLIPSKFAIAGFTEVAVIICAVILAGNGDVSRFDGIVLFFLWVVAMVVLRRYGEEKISADVSEELPVGYRPRRLIVFILMGFAGIGIGSYLLIESVTTISRALGISEYFISFFIVGLGTSLPELVVEVAAIRKRHYELALGDIIGSCIVDSTLAIGLGPIFFPIKVSGRAVLLTGLYSALVSSIVVSILVWRSVNDKRSGAFFILLYMLSLLIPYLA